MVDWPKIVERHGPMVWKTAMRLVGNEADAADCYQNVFMSALKVTHKEEVTNWAGLLSRIAMIESIGLLRRRYRSGRNRESVLDESQLVGTGSTPELGAQATELVDDLRVALTRLDRRQSEVFCLACMEGLSYQQIADQMKLDRNYVGVLLSRARATLRNELASHLSTTPKSVLSQEEQT